MTLVAGKDWRQEEKGMTEDEMDGSINSMNMSLRKVHEMLKDKEAWHAAVHGFTEPDTTGWFYNNSFESVKWRWKSVSCVWLMPWAKVHGILQARIMEWVDFPFSGGSSQPRDQT